MTVGPPGNQGSYPSQGPNLIPPAKFPLLHEVMCPGTPGSRTGTSLGVHTPGSHPCELTQQSQGTVGLNQGPGASIDSEENIG